jgi:hypothetical protein
VLASDSSESNSQYLRVGLSNNMGNFTDDKTVQIRHTVLCKEAMAEASGILSEIAWELRAFEV